MDLLLLFAGSGGRVFHENDTATTIDGVPRVMIEHGHGLL